MKAFITGATGFIGSHLADMLIDSEEWDEVRCLVRKNEKWLRGKDFRKYEGDLHDIQVLKNAVEGVDVVFHLAGRVKARSYSEFERANVAATENLLRIVQKAEVKKFIILSSLAAAGPSEGSPKTEEDPMLPISMYGRSKKQMEEMVHRLAGEGNHNGISITILRPSAVYGPREDQIYTFFKLAAKRICPIIGNGQYPKVSMVYVKDVIQGILNAVRYERKGVNTYFISGAKVNTWNEIRGTTSAVLGKKMIPVYIKPALVKKIATLIEKSASAFGVYPVINREKANEMILEWTCTIDKAREELNYEPEYSLEEGIARTIHWYKQHHWL